MDSNDGLIFAYLLDGEGGGNAVAWQGISDWQSDMGVLRKNEI
jgi:zinc transporter